MEAEFTIQNDFPPVGYDQWRALAEEAISGASFEESLVTRTYDDIDLQPIYCRSDAPGVRDRSGFPGIHPFVRGASPLGAVLSGWDVRPEHAHPEIDVTNRAILDDVHGGARSVLLRFDGSTCSGCDPDPRPDPATSARLGVMAYSVDDLDQVFAGVDLKDVAISIDAGAAFLPASAMLVALWQRRSVSSTDVRGALNADPLAALARDGSLHVGPRESLSQMAVLAKWAAANYPNVTSVGVDTTPYHEAGATAAQDIGLALATAVEYLRAMNMDVDRVSRQFLFRFGLGTHHFLAIAKLRAARRVWARAIQACGQPASVGAMRIHARTSNRVLTRHDPYVNLLRNTVAVFAAGVGGAEAITSVPFDAMIGFPTDFSRRVARNTVFVLQHEAHLNRVIDPAGGSWFLEQLTDQLAHKAWSVFQETERRGGMLAALQSGWISDQIDEAFARRALDIACRKLSITGVSEFPDTREPLATATPVDLAAVRSAATERVARNRVDNAAPSTSHSQSDRMNFIIKAAGAGATVGQLAREIGFHQETQVSVPPFEPRRFAEPFEELRDASDVWRQKLGHRPRVFLANMGPIAQYSARATSARSVFESGGFEVIGIEACDSADVAAKAFVESAAGIAVICSSNERYPDLVPRLAPPLKAAGARTVVLAGDPGDHASQWRAAGVDRFLLDACDVLETLRELLREEGVLEGSEG